MISKMHNKKIFFISVLIFFSFTHELSALSEDQVKTAYIYNIAKFIKWDKEAFKSKDTALEICIVTQDSDKKAFDLLRNKKVLGHPINVSYLILSDEIDKCNIIYITGYNKTQIKKELKNIKHKKILTMGDAYQFSEIGGMIELRLQKEKVKIHINIEALNSANYSISYKVLEISTIVKGKKND